MEQNSASVVECKKCNFTFTSLLRHLSQKDACKKAYSDEELNNLKSEARERASKKRKIWKKENKDYLSFSNAEYHVENRERILEQKKDYYDSHKIEISKQRAKTYVNRKENKEVMRLRFEWSLHAPHYYDKKKSALSKWEGDYVWQIIIDELKNSKMATIETDLRLDNLKKELDCKVKELHDIQLKEVQDIEKELGIPEEREFKNYLNDKEFEFNIFLTLRQYLEFKRRHISYYGQDKLKEFAKQLQETLDPEKTKYWATDQERNRVNSTVELEEVDQLKINEEYFHEVRPQMFVIHRNALESSKSLEEIRAEYRKLRKPPAFVYFSPNRLFPSSIECSRERGLIS